MPRTVPKRATKLVADAKPTCDLCCDVLEIEKDVLKYEGECGCNVHRYCAGVTKHQYTSFKDGNNPFVCQWCSLKTARAVIHQLQSEVASLQEELAKAKEELAKQRDEQLRPLTYASAVVASATTATSNSNSSKRQRQGPPRRS
jgi:hypothetical protein